MIPNPGVADRPSLRLLVPRRVHEMSVSRPVGRRVGERLVQVRLRESRGRLGFVLGVDDRGRLASDPPNEIGPDRDARLLVQRVPVLGLKTPTWAFQQSYKPPGKGRADSVWIFDQEWWLTIEAKSEALATGLVSMDDVRRTNTQLQSLAADRGTEIPSGSVSVIVTPKQLADPDAVAIAQPHVQFSHPPDVLTLAHDTIEAWRDIRSSATNLEGAQVRSVVRQRFADRHILPSAVRERIADKPIAG